MEIPTAEDNYEEAKQTAKLFYSSIRRVWCPALEEYVTFNKIGFRHLMENGRKPRSKNDQKRRFLLLLLAAGILSNANAEPMYRHSIITKTQFWALSERQDRELVTVIVRQVGAGNKHFFSIYNKKSLIERFLCFARHQWSGKGLEPI